MSLLLMFYVFILVMLIILAHIGIENDDMVPEEDKWQHLVALSFVFILWPALLLVIIYAALLSCWGEE